jgi:hypothetical protein
MEDISPSLVLRVCKKKKKKNNNQMHTILGFKFFLPTIAALLPNPLYMHKFGNRLD